MTGTFQPVDNGAAYFGLSPSPTCGSTANMLTTQVATSNAGTVCTNVSKHERQKKTKC